MEIVIIVLVLGIIIGTVGFIAGRKGRGTVELEPPPTPTRIARPAAPIAPQAVRSETAAPSDATPIDVEPELERQVEEAFQPPIVAEPEPAFEPEPETEPVPEPDVVAPVKPRFRDRLTKARALLSGYVGSVLSRGTIDDETWDELEEALVRADVGVGLTTSLLDDVRTRVKAESLTTPDALIDALKVDMVASLSEGDRSLRFEPGAPNVWLFVGVNGVGKTTTIGKLGRREATAGRGVVMAAADTFRAAAAEQLELWAERADADLVRGAEGADPGSVVFDAVQRAAARGSELVLADTAGRLHNKVNLMEELKKIRRISERDPARLTEVLLVIDATTGQNGLVQAKEFADAVGVTGIVLTKLDGTAKGGIALAIESELGIPIKLVGLGETVDDLIDFDPQEFVDALFS